MNENMPAFEEREVFDQVFQLLLQESALYERLIEVMQLKQKAIIGGDTESLKQFSSREQSYSVRIKTILQSRAALTRKLFESWGFSSDDLSLGKLIQCSVKAWDPNWLKIYQRIRLYAEQINKLNFGNNELLRSSMTYVRDLVQVIFSDKDKNSQLYDRKGAMKNSNKKVFDYQI